MDSLFCPKNALECQMCGNLVPEESWPEHLSADVRLINIIKATHPEWNRQECEDYLREFNSGLWRNNRSVLSYGGGLRVIGGSEGDQTQMTQGDRRTE